MKERVECVTDKIMSLFKTNTTKDYSEPRRIENLHDRRKKPRKLKIQKQYEDNIKSIRNFFRLKKEIRDINQ